MKKIRQSRAYYIGVPAELSFDEALQNPKRTLIMQMSYDEKGNLTENLQYDIWGESTGFTLSRYNDEGQLVTEEIYDSDGNLEEKTINEYQDGRLIKSYVHYLDESMDTVHYHYDEAGNLIKKVWINDEGIAEKSEEMVYENNRLVRHEILEEGETTSLRQWEYDEMGRILSHSVENEEGQYRQENTFNADGQLIQIQKVDESGEMIEQQLMEYDADNHLIRSKTITDDSVTITEMVYQNDRLVSSTEITRLKDGTITEQIERRMDEDGNLTEFRVIRGNINDPAFSKYIVVYEYDYFS